MGFFGFKSSKEVEEEKRQAAEEAARRVEQNNLTNLSNLSKGSQLNFAIPYFDVFDPRLQDYGVPVSVHGAVVYAIEDMDLFHSVNRNEGYSDETFKNKLRGQLTKFIKSVVSNAPSDAQIPVVQIERKIFEISELIQQRVTPQVEKLFGITIRSLDITGINVDKESRGYRELKALTADLEKERMMAQHRCQAWVLLFLRYSIILASMVSSMVHAIGTSSSSSFSRVSSLSSHTFGRTVWHSGSLPAM